MKVIIAGSRSFGSYGHFEQLRLYLEMLEHERGWTITEVVWGCAAGADCLGRQWAQRGNRRIKAFRPDWQRHGKAAGPIRNRQMAEYADRAVVFWDGKSRGSKNMIEEMQRLGKPVEVVRFTCQ